MRIVKEKGLSAEANGAADELRRRAEERLNSFR